MNNPVTNNSGPPQNKSRNLNITRIIIILSIVIALFSLYILLFIELPDKPIAGKGGLGEENIPIGGEFTLINQNGNEFNSREMQGQFSLVYFGFTFCPDICITSLQKLTEVVTTLEKYQIKTLPIFITIDPARDTPATLKPYLNHFHPAIIGLTGTKEQIKQVADLYKVYYAKSATIDNNNNSYMLDHSSFIYLMDKKGKYIKHFSLDTQPEEIIEYIRINK